MQQILKYPILFFSGFLFTFLLTPWIRKIALKLDVTDKPDSRRIHDHPIPYGGGIAVFSGFHIACIVLFFIPWSPFSGIIDFIWWQNFFVVSFLLLIVGLIDDIWTIGPIVKLLCQIFIAALSFTYDIRIGNLLGFELPILIDLSLTVIWIVAIVNAFNLIDGMDGLAIGIAAISSCGIAGSLLFRHLPGDALILIALIGVCLAFLKYNYHPATIFLGDSGSMFLGLTLATVSISTASIGTAMASIGVPLLAMGVPVFDTVLAIWRRSVRGYHPSTKFKYF